MKREEEVQSVAGGSEDSTNNCHYISDNNFVEETGGDESNDNVDVKDLFQTNLAQFYLKLEAEFLIPASTIQYIITEFQALHSQDLDMLAEDLSEKLSKKDVPKWKIKEILNDFHGVHGGECTFQRR